LQLYTRRVKAQELICGDANFHKELVLRQLERGSKYSAQPAQLTLSLSLPRGTSCAFGIRRCNSSNLSTLAPNAMVNWTPASWETSRISAMDPGPATSSRNSHTDSKLSWLRDAGNIRNNAVGI